MRGSEAARQAAGGWLLYAQQGSSVRTAARRRCSAPGPAAC